MRGIRAGPQPRADTMRLRPASVPVLMGEQPERVRRWSEPRLGVTWDRFGWRRALDDPGMEVLT
jgi:hypothetical protein